MNEQPARDAEPQIPPEPPARGEAFFNLPGVIVAMVAVMAAIQLVSDNLLGPGGQTWLFFQASVIPARYDEAVHGAWFWSPLTYSLLHGGWTHLIINAVWLAAFGSVVARRIGTARFLALWAFSAVAAALLFVAFHRGEILVMVGASGVVSAMMAAATRFAFQRGGGFSRQYAHLAPRLTLAQSLSNRSVVTFLGVWFGINLLAAIGFTPGAGEASVAWEAHVGGFLFGFLAFDLFDPMRPIDASGAGNPH